MEPIVPRSIVHERAKQAAERGVPLADAMPWPVGSDAGQLFQREYQAVLALRRAQQPLPQAA